uniref:START domain-containing protein n=1 Tax=Globisporangium ultimum (strain ATCC 200006 / CBS 805.95 / DAOM BR144) TaxID=431595 RepID=K3XBC6_GLOUD
MLTNVTSTANASRSLDVSSKPPPPEVFTTINLIFNDLKHDSAASKRKRHALSMAKGRSRQRQELTSLRQQREILQRKLCRALQTQQQGNEFVGSDSGIESARHSVSDRRSKLSRAYVAAVEQQNSIQREIEAVQKLIEQFQIFEAALAIDTPLLLPSTPDSSQTSVNHARSTAFLAKQDEEAKPRGMWTHFMDDEEPFYFEPCHRYIAHRLIRDTHQASKQFDSLFSHNQLNAIENNFFGWKVQRSVSSKNHFRFHFTKRVPCVSSFEMANDLLDATWETFHSPELYARLYRTVMVSRVMQRVDDVTSIILRNSPSDKRTHHVRILTLVTKVEDKNEHGQRVQSILTLVMDPSQAIRQSRNDVVFIRDGYTYISFTEIDDEITGQPMVEVTYGGHGYLPSAAHAAYLLMETGAALVRWEQFIMPTRLVTVQ